MAPRAVKEFEVHPYVQFMGDKYGAYRRWIESEGIPIVSGSYVADIRTMELAEWKRRGEGGLPELFRSDGGRRIRLRNCPGWSPKTAEAPLRGNYPDR